MPEVLTSDQRRTLPARQALARKFTNDEERSAYYRRIGEKASAGRLVLSHDETAALATSVETLTALGEAYRILAAAAARARQKSAGASAPDPSERDDDAAAADESETAA